MKKIGLLGGSFDPIHFGHLHLALSLLEKCGLDQVLFCPARCSPFKMKHPPHASDSDRLAMLRLAIQEIPEFQVFEFELRHPAPSYTIDTVRHLQAPHQKLHLLLSSDVAASFHEWKSADQLLQLSPPLIGCRNQTELSDSPWKEKLLPCFVQTPCLDISSTEIRQRLKQNLYSGHLLPKAVLDFIKQQRLYS